MQAARKVTIKAGSYYSGPMEFIKTIAKSLGLSDRQLALRTEARPQRLSYWQLHAEKMEEFLRFLVRLRKVSGMSWTKIGQLLDEEYLKEEKDKKKD